MGDQTNGKFTKVEMEMALDHLQNGLWFWLERVKIDAKVRKAKFDALVKEGFSESQALEIVSKSATYE